jgi:hypothetical protein
MDFKKLVDPRQAAEDELGHRGKRLAPGFYWAGFGDAGYQRRVVRFAIVAAIAFGIRIIVS